MLELKSPSLGLQYRGPDCTERNAPAEAADLPPGFHALWLRCCCLSVGCAGYPGGAAVSSVVVAEEVCRLLSLAPQSYTEFWLILGGRRPFLLSAEWLLLPSSVARRSTDRFESSQALVAAMQRFAAVYGLTVSVSDDQMLHVVLSVV